MDEKNEPGHTIERITLNGVELPIATVTVADPNEAQVDRVVATLEQIDAAEVPAYLISTATTWST